MSMPTSLLQVVPATAQELSPQQKKFNTLMQRIAKERNVLREWETAIALFRKRHRAQIEPLRQKNLDLKEALLHLFDSLADQKLAQDDREHLGMLIRSYVDELLESEPGKEKTAELKLIYNRHAEVDYDEVQAKLELEQEQLLRTMAWKRYGVQFEEDEVVTFESVQLKVEQKLRQEALEQENGEPSENDETSEKKSAKHSSKSAKKNAAKALKLLEAQKQASQSVRDIYRKLVSSLHPDREPDPVVRKRKTELMQRVNHAYAEGQLLQLLELQLEIAQIDSGFISSLSEDRLKYYNLVLNEQWREIKKEVESMLDSFKAEFGLLLLESISPKKLVAVLASEVATRKHDLLILQRQLRTFTQDPSLFKGWLKESRQHHKRRGF
jgi:hypothetical protein